jgi:cation:H+ antiporter
VYDTPLESLRWPLGPNFALAQPNHPLHNQDSMLVNSLEVIGGLVLLIWGADRFVHGASAGARTMGVPPLMIGLTIVAFATSAPEILVSIVAALRGEPGLAFGNAIGSNIVNIGLVLGCTALLKPIQLRSATLRREMPALLAVSLLTVSLFLDTYLSRVDGLVMLTGLVIVMIWLARLGLRSSANDPLVEDFEAEIPQHVSMPSATLWFAIGLFTLLIGANLLVDGSIEVARALGVSEVVIGVTLVALGTSLPELAVSIISVMKNEHGLAIGNIVGSNIFNLLAVIGIAAAIEPAALAPSVLSLHMFVMVAFTLVLFAMTYDYDGKSELSRLEGFALCSAYVAYVSYVVVQNV